MSYKFVIKEAELDEGAIEDYYNKLAAQQGAKTTRSLGIQEPSKAQSGPDPRIAAYYAKKAAEKAKADKSTASEKAKTDKATAAAAEKQQKDTEKQYARDYAGLQKQDKLDQKASAQKTIDDARKEIGFLTTIAREMRTATGLDDATLQLALDAITQKYIGRGTLAEADEPDIKPLGASAGAAIFKKYYGDILDAQAFSDFQSARQIIDFLYLYEQNLQKVQDTVKQITGGKQLKISPKLVAAFQKTNKYVEQITGNSAATATATTAVTQTDTSAPTATASTTDTTTNIQEDAYSGLFDKFLPKQYKTPNSAPFKPNSYGNFTLKE